MNKWGKIARDHWARWLPAAYETAGDPEVFFTGLGERAQAAIEHLAGQIAGDDVPGEGYLGKVNRLAWARQQAEETVLAQMILLEPEQETLLAEEEEDERERQAAEEFWKAEPLIPETDEEAEQIIAEMTRRNPPPPGPPTAGKTPPA